jgi:hypothetical protein
MRGVATGDMGANNTFGSPCVDEQIGPSEFVGAELPSQ